MKVWSTRLSLVYLCTLAFASVIASLKPDTIQLHEAMQSSSSLHWLGTDALGRDLLIRILTGARISLSMGLLCSLLSMALGVSVGGLSAMLGGRWDQMMMRFLEVLSSLPQMMTIGLMVLFFTQKGEGASGFLGMLKISVAIALGSWMIFARFTRNLTLREKSNLYVESAYAMGVSSYRIFVRHIMRNILYSLLVMMGLQIPNFLLFESFLSFLGIGVQPPTPSWGMLMQEGWRTMAVYPTQLLYPAGMLFLTILSLNILFDHWRDQLLVSFAPVDTHH